MPMNYISLFSGIEAASVAWEPLGFDPVAFSEIDEFPSAVLAERFPDVPNLGDVEKVDWSGYRGKVDVVVGGSPCQSFSIAGNRTGLEGASGLMWEYVRCVRDVRPKWVVWENVPGALSSSHGDDFRCLLASLDELGYGLAWRVLDAQFFGVAQRRRRVFVVGHLGDRRAADVLFEPESLRWDSPSSRAKREALAGRPDESTCASGFCWHAGAQANAIGFEAEQSPTVVSVKPPAACYTMVVRCGCEGGGKGALVQDDVSATLATSNNQTLFQPICMAGDHGKSTIDADLSGTLTAHDAKGAPIVTGCLTPWDVQSRRIHSENGSWPSLYAGEGGGHGYVFAEDDVDGAEYTVRRLTPRECERLQGFPDDWTLVEWNGKPAPDGKRYKAIGNSMAVPVMRWIGERMAEVERRG